MFRRIFPHAAVILSIMYIVLFHIGSVKPEMAYIENDITKALLYALCVLSVVNAIVIISDDRKKRKKAYLKAKRKGAGKK